MCRDYKHVEKTQNIFGGIAAWGNRPKVSIRVCFLTGKRFASPRTPISLPPWVGLQDCICCQTLKRLVFFIFIDRKVDAASRLCALQDRPAISHGMGKPHPMPVGKT
jgi:hypothetical protein